MKNKYLFTSKRIGFRAWKKEDLNDFALINADPAVMRHFPKVLSIEETADLIERLQKLFDEHGYCYYATEVLATKELIGFIGINYQSYESSFSPGTDIGWRLKQSSWGKGYATEGAVRCLEHAFQDLKLEKVFAVCTIANSPSENVMKKIGMTKKGIFNHPKLKEFPSYEKCVWYEIENPTVE